MDQEQRNELQKRYEMLSDEGLLELVSVDKDDFEEEAYMMLTVEAKRRNLQIETEKPIEEQDTDTPVCPHCGEKLFDSKDLSENEDENAFFCTECFNKIPADAERCPHCGAAFENPDEEIIIVASFKNEADARMAKDLLKQQGIESFISKGDAGDFRPELALGYGGVHLHVFESTKDAASEIIKSSNITKG